MEGIQAETQTDGDYVFHYRLNESGQSMENAPERGHDAPNDLLHLVFKNLLDLLIPCSGGKEVKIDGFKLLSEKHVIRNLYKTQERPAKSSQENIEETAQPASYGVIRGSFGHQAAYQSSKNASLYEPRIEFIKETLENILRLIELEQEGKALQVDGFRLKALTHWTAPSNGDPSEVVESIGTRCNCDCVFCYNKGNPPGLALTTPERSQREEFEEVLTRLKYFEPEKGRGLFSNLGSPCEVLAHPKALQVLKLARAKSTKPLRLITNGSSLRPEVIEELVLLKPLYLDISLNSATPGRRQKLMRDGRPEIAIQALPLLRQKGIPFAIVIVPWLLDGDLEALLQDLEETVAYVDAQDAHLVQVSLPGYTQYFSSQELFSTEEVWGRIAAKVRSLRRRYRVPIVVRPALFEEHEARSGKNTAEVIGVVKNSPADRGGVKLGDVLLEMNGLRVQNRIQARQLISLLAHTGQQHSQLLISRKGEIRSLELFLEDRSYPSTPASDSHLGLIFLGTGFSTAQLEGLNALILKHEAQRVLFLSSRLVKPLFEESLRRYPLKAPQMQLSIEVPSNRYFGGNIFMGDLLVVEDFILHVKDYLKREEAPQLIIIPSSPFQLGDWGRDLTGRSYLDIERNLGIPVELLECETIYD